MLALVALLFGGFIPTAHALSCVWGVHSVNVEDGDDEVPLNARFVVNHTFDDPSAVELVLVDASGAAIAAELEVVDRNAWLTPDEALQPASAYTLRAEGESGLSVSFRTGQAVDDEAPEMPQILDIRRDRSSSEWGVSEGIVVEVVPVDGASHYDFEIATTEDFSDAKRYASAWPSAYLGTTLCDNTVEGYDHGQRYFVRVRSVDLAGNSSDWTDQAAPKGCSSVGGTGSGLLVVLGGLLATRRRQNWAAISSTSGPGSA